MMRFNSPNRSLASLLGAMAMGWTTILAQAQNLPASPLDTAYNSTFSLSASQIAAANLSDDIVTNVNIIMNTDLSVLANGGALEDDFYTLPSLNNTSSLLPGQVLKVQEVTDSLPFAISPGTTLSRILYTTETVNGTILPASAYVLWPYLPRKRASKPPVILWTHGTSGFFPNAGPSVHRSLYYGDILPGALAQAGYAVVAPDYAGLGLGQSWDGSQIPHQYFLPGSGARDAVYSLQAAHDAFENRLDKKFAVMGHSQGGGVSWAAAEYLQALKQNTTATMSSALQEVIEGYVGTITVAPITKSLKVGVFAAAAVGMMLDSVYPDFQLDQWLTPLGVKRVELLREIQGSVFVTQQLFMNEPEELLLKSDWMESSYHARAFEQLADPGNKPIAGPMLVIQGTEDLYVPEPLTAEAVENTCQVDPDTAIEYAVVDGYGHTPIISALRLVWMQWLDDRFDGKSAESGCIDTDFPKIEGSAQAGNSFPLYAATFDVAHLNLGLI